MADYHTQLNTYKINQPTICFKCCLFFDRVYDHLAWKHVERNMEEYHSTLSSYRYNTKKVLASLQTHQHKIHNGRDLLACIKSINIKPKRPLEPSLQEESLRDKPNTSNNQQTTWVLPENLPTTWALAEKGHWTAWNILPNAATRKICSSESSKKNVVTV